MTTTLRVRDPRSILFLLALIASLGLYGCGGGSGGEGDSPSLVAGFAPGVPDTIRPAVSDTSPENSEIDVALNSSISVTFSEPMKISTLNASSFTLKVTTGNAPVAGTVVASGSVATFVPSANLGASTQFTATVTTAARDVANNSLAANFTWNFTTGIASDTTPPTVSATSPVNGAIDVATNSSVSATFSEAMTNSTLNAASFIVSNVSTGDPISGIVSVNGSTVRFTPSSPLDSSTEYNANILPTVKDASGNFMASDFSWNFITAAAPDTTPPTVASTVPQDAALGVALNASISATFSEAMINSTLNTASYTLRPTAGGATVGGTVSVSGNTARFTPSASLAGSTQYTATITTAAKDAAGNALAANFTWRFTTASVPDTTPPNVLATSPVNGASGVALTSTISVVFSEAMKNSTLSTASFRLVRTSNSAAVAGTVSGSGGTTSTSATFTPSVNLAAGIQYTATVTTAVQDAAGNALAANYSWTFSTVAGDTTPPTVSATSPISDATDVAVGAQVSATFSEAMTNSTLNTASFQLTRSAGGVAVTGTVNVTGNTATFTPSANLSPGILYSATITTAAKDTSANSMAADFTWNFTTAAPTTTALLIWDPATAPALSGYRVYYGTVPGVYGQSLGNGINVGNVLTHTITGLISGVRYYFAVTAYESSGNESGYSNEVFKDIP